MPLPATKDLPSAYGRSLVVVAMGVALVSGCGAAEEAPGPSSQAAGGESSEPEQTGDGDATIAGAELGRLMLDAMTAAGTASFTGETSAEGGGTTTEGVLRIEAAGTSMRAATQVQGTTVEVVLLPDGAYVSTGDTGDGRPWTRVDAASPDPTAAAMGQFLETFRTASDPRSSAEVFRQSGDFTVVGPEQIEGVATTRYRGAVPPQALLSSFPEEMRARLEPLLGTEPFGVEIWMDDEGRPLRFVQSTTLQGREATSTQTFSGWGEPVEIQAPPADQIDE